MAEESTVTTEVTQTENAADNKMQQAFTEVIWGKTEDTQTNVAATTETKAEQNNTVVTSTTQTTNDDEELLEPNDWIKREFEVDSIDTLKAEREEYKKLKESKPFEYKNDESKRIAEYINEGKEDELYSFLDTKKKVQKLSTADLSDKNVAAELVKFGIQKDNPNLNTDEVEFLYNEKYGIPEKPVQGELEDEPEYNERLSKWRSQVNNIEKRLVIEAKINQPKLAQLNKELVLPEIKKENQSSERVPSPEELAEFEQAKSSFLQAAKQTIEGFNGFTAQVKDKDVNFSVGYTPSKEEKAIISEKLNTLAESGFDANGLFADRWYDMSSKTFKIDQMTKDLSRIFMGDNADQKLAVDAANKRLEAYLAEKKNVSVKEGNRDSTFNPDAVKNVSEKLAASFFG